jgi:hypothetical protein
MGDFMAALCRFADALRKENVWINVDHIRSLRPHTTLPATFITFDDKQDILVEGDIDTVARTIQNADRT